MLGGTLKELGGAQGVDKYMSVLSYVVVIGGHCPQKGREGARETATRFHDDTTTHPKEECLKELTWSRYDFMANAT